MCCHARFEDNRHTSDNCDLIGINEESDSVRVHYSSLQADMEDHTSSPASASAMEHDNDDAALNIRLESIFSALLNILNVAAPSNADIGDTHRMNIAATDSNRKHLHGGKKASAANTPPSIPVGKIDEAEAQKVSKDLESLKNLEGEIGTVFDIVMQYVEGDGPYRYSSDADMSTELQNERGEKEETVPESTDAKAITAVCANNNIFHPMKKLQLFSWFINSKGIQVDKLAQLLNSRNGSSALWMMLPSLINSSMDIIVKLCCVWSVYASMIDLNALASKETGVDNNCLLSTNDASVKSSVAYVNTLIKARRDTMVHAPSAASDYATNEAHRSIKNRRGIMATHLANIISPLLNNATDLLNHNLIE